MTKHQHQTQSHGTCRNIRYPGILTSRDPLMAVTILSYDLHFNLIVSGFPTEEAKRNVLNFCFVYCLPRSMQLQEGLMDNSENEGIEDEPVAFDAEDLLEATLTHVHAGAKQASSH